MRRKATIATLSSLAVIALLAAPRLASSPDRSSAAESAFRSSLDEPLLVLRAPPRAVIIGGGSEPSSTQVSIEQDVELAAEVLPGPSVLLFGSGSHGHSVVEAPGEAPSSLRARLALFFGA